MNINESIVNDMSQQISESYLHLSQDNPPSDSTSLIDFTDEDEGYCNMSKLMRLAEVIDRKSPENVTTITDADQDKISTEKIEPNVNGRTYLTPESPKISSHSTPIIPKNYGLKFERFPDLSQIEESIEDDEKFASNKDFSQTQNIPQSSSGSDNAYESVFSLLNKDVNELHDIKKVIDFVLRQKTQKNEKTNRSPKKLFTTPLRKQFHNNTDTSEEENDDDDLSLRDNRGAEMDDYRDRDSISPITTPPQSQELFNTLNKVQLTGFSGDQDVSYIPKWARNSTPDINLRTESQQSEDFNALIIALKKEMDELRNQTVILQKENISLRENIELIKLESSKSQSLPKESEIEFKIDAKITQFIQEIKLLESNNQQMKQSLNECQTHNEKLKSEINQLNEKLVARDRIATMETPPIIQENLSQSYDRQEKYDNMSTFQNSSNLSNNTIIGEESIEETPSKSELNDLYDLLSGKDLEIKNLNLIINSLKAKIGDEHVQLTEKSVDSKFADYYRKLQLIKIDSLSKTEVSNLLKNLLLSLLISDYDNLPQNAIKYGKFLRIAIQFLDTLHDKLYDNRNRIKPSYYLKNESFGNIDDLCICLDGMLHEIRL